MGILISWQLVFPSVLILTSFNASHLTLSHLLLDPTLSENRNGKPLPTKVSSIQSNSVCVNIYDSQITSNSKKIYYYSPIALLDPLKVTSVANKIPSQGSLSISFFIWNQDVGIEVAYHLSQVLNQNVEPSQVQVFPFESVRLTSRVQSDDFSLTNEWLTDDRKQQYLRFTLNCPTRENCNRMKTEINKNPENFQHLQLEFNPQFLNDDLCMENYNHGEGLSQDVLSIQVKALTKSLEETKLIFMEELTNAKQESANLAIELNAFREETRKEADSQKLLEDKIKVTEENLAMALENLEKTRSELTQTIADLSTKLNAGTSDIAVDIGQMPTSCADLQRMGHRLSGFFSVKGSKRMEMVYCNFYRNDKQKWIGYADVKSAPVHFYVQRNSNFGRAGTPIPFDLAVVNNGNDMDLTSGKFTAPRPGIYFFSFTGLPEFPASSSHVRFGVGLFLNGGLIGKGFVEEANHVNGQNDQVTVQSTLNLKSGDQVWVQVDHDTSTGVKLFDSSVHYTHFTGFMLEEEIVASL